MWTAWLPRRGGLARRRASTFFSRQVQPLERAADGARRHWLTNRLGHFGQGGIGLLLDQRADLRLVRVVVRPLVVSPCRRSGRQATVLPQPLGHAADPR